MRRGLRHEASRCACASKSAIVAVPVPVAATEARIVRRWAGRNSLRCQDADGELRCGGDSRPGRDGEIDRRPERQHLDGGRPDDRARRGGGVLVDDGADGEAGRDERLLCIGGTASGERRQRAQADRRGADVAGEIGFGELEGARVAGDDRAQLRLELRRVEVGEPPAVGVQLHLGDRA